MKTITCHGEQFKVYKTSLRLSPTGKYLTERYVTVVHGHQVSILAEAYRPAGAREHDVRQVWWWVGSEKDEPKDLVGEDSHVALMYAVIEAAETLTKKETSHASHS